MFLGGHDLPNMRVFSPATLDEDWSVVDWHPIIEHPVIRSSADELISWKDKELGGGLLN